MQDVRPDAGSRQNNGAIDEKSGEQSRQNDVPEPEKNVRFFVDDVQRKDAERVVGLNRSGSTEFLKSALGHARKDVHHGIETIFLRLIAERHHPKTVAEEFSVEEIVHQDQLSDDVDEAESLAEEITKSVQFVSLQKKNSIFVFRALNQGFTVTWLSGEFVLFFQAKFSLRHRLSIN